MLHAHRPPAKTLAVTGMMQVQMSQSGMALRLLSGRKQARHLLALVCTVHPGSYTLSIPGLQYAILCPVAALPTPVRLTCRHWKEYGGQEAGEDGGPGLRHHEWRRCGAPGRKAVQQLHEMFDWAERSRKGLLLFIDEADAFLGRRGNQMSEVCLLPVSSLALGRGNLEELVTQRSRLPVGY